MSPAFFPVLNTPTTAYTVQPGTAFLDPGYYAATGYCHESVDFNAVTGGDTDLGDPVHAADDGVVSVTMWSPSIGGIVLIEHADGSESHYWHLRDIHVKKGQRVEGGDFIGQIGKGGKEQWPSHLHFGIRKKARTIPADYWPGFYYKNRAAQEKFIRDNYHEPLGWLAARGALKKLSDLQELRNAPTRVVIMRGDAAQDVTGQLVELPENSLTLDARTSGVKLYLNSRPQPTDVPAAPPAPPADAPK